MQNVKEIKHRNFSGVYEIGTTDEGSRVDFISYDKLSDLIQDYEQNLKTNFWHIEAQRLPGGSDETWANGEYKTNAASMEAIKKATPLQKHLDAIEKEKSKLYQLHPQLSTLQLLAQTKKRKRVFSDIGNDLDIDRYINRSEDCYITRTKAKKVNAVNIFINGSIPGKFDPKELLNNSIFYCAIVEILESAGLSVGIQSGSFSTFVKTGTVCLYTFSVKEHSETTDIPKIFTSILPFAARSLRLSMIANIMQGFKDYKTFGFSMKVSDLPNSEPGKEAIKHKGIDLILDHTIVTNPATFFEQLEQVLNGETVNA